MSAFTVLVVAVVVGVAAGAVVGAGFMFVAVKLGATPPPQDGKRIVK